MFVHSYRTMGNIGSMLTVLRRMEQCNTHIYTIGISGASCSGKSWLANKIRSISPNTVTILSMDSYYKNVEYINTLEYRHDNPEAIDYNQFLRDFSALRNGESVSLPIYDYERHKVVGHEQIQAHSLLVVEGLFVFYDVRIRKLYDLKIWTEAPNEILFARRMERDIRERGDTDTSARNRYYHDVVPAFDKFISELKANADIIINTNIKVKS